MSTEPGFDLVIIGAGVVGAALARALAGRRSVLVIDRGAHEGRGLTSRNSGVIHSGLYYPPGSLKSRTCIRGQELLYAWCAAHGIPHAALGKLVIARTADQLPDLEALAAQALAAGARDTAILDGRDVARREPALPAVAGALWCPWSGIVDPIALTRSLRAAAEARGVTFAMGLAVQRIARAAGGGFCVEAATSSDSTTLDSVTAGQIINAAGLDADRLAARSGIVTPTIHPCRGDYFRLHGARGRYHHLLYPLRQAASAGLGIHLTIELDGGLRLGPDAEYVADRDDDTPAPAKGPRFFQAAQHLLGPLDPNNLTYESCGIRPSLRPPGATTDPDFLILEDPPGCFHLLGIESPGLTAALALAEELAATIF